MSATWNSDEIAISALGDLTEERRAVLLIDQLVKLNGPRTITLLGMARAAINARIEEVICEQVIAETARIEGLTDE